ncbi:MAG: hypothetical protein ABUL72_05290, partial [Armatimonadota bacterium]
LPMTWTRWCMVAYSVAMAAFGAYGTMMHPEELKSLIAGVGVGAIVLALMFWSRKSPRPAYIIALLVGLAVSGNAVASIMKKGFYPQGVVLILSLGLIGALLGGHLSSMAAKKAAGQG